MDDHDALRINTIKGQLETVLADLQITELDSNEYDQQAWAYVCFKLAEAREALAEAAVKCGAHSEGPVPFNKNTAQEMANFLAYAMLGGDPRLQ